MGKRTLHHTPEPPKRGPGAPKGNQNAKGGPGGTGVPPGVKNALKYGLYSVGHTEEEKSLYPHMKIGTLDDEIRNARLMLRRACKAQLLWEYQKGIFNEQIRQGVKAALGSTTAAELFHVDTVEIKEGIITADVVADGEDIPVQIGTPVSETKIIRRKADFSAEILKYTKLVMKLEQTQHQLMQEGSGEDYARQLAEDLRAFGDNALSTMPGSGHTQGEA